MIGVNTPKAPKFRACAASSEHLPSRAGSYHSLLKTVKLRSALRSAGVAFNRKAPSIGVPVDRHLNRVVAGRQLLARNHHHRAQLPHNFAGVILGLTFGIAVP